MTTTIEIASTLATIAAVIGVVLSNHKNLKCYYFWFFSNGITLAVHVYSNLWAMSARDAIFLALAVHGLHKWRKQ